MKQPILKFLPLLILYVVLVLLFSTNSFEGDEGGYVGYAKRITEGVSSEGGTALWWGPGYPIVLTPFVILNLPWLAAKLLNSVFLFGAILFFYKTLHLYLENKYATVVTLLLGVYPPFIREIQFLLTESLVFFLVCGFMFIYCKAHHEPDNSKVNVLAAAFFLGYLALTKVFYGYVILVGLLIYTVLFIWRRTEWARKTMVIYFFSLIFCLPFLIYTYSITGRFFYWGTSGGMSLFWMSTSNNENELGSWFSENDVSRLPELSSYRDFFGKISGLSQVEMDDAFKQQAFKNITEHPVIYIKNWSANIGRLLFSYPFSSTSQKISTYYYLLPNMFIVVLFILSIWPMIINWKTIPPEFLTLLLFVFLSFCGTSLISAYDRQFRPLVPVLLLWISFAFFRLVRIELQPENDMIIN